MSLCVFACLQKSTASGKKPKVDDDKYRMVQAASSSSMTLVSKGTPDSQISTTPFSSKMTEVTTPSSLGVSMVVTRDHPVEAAAPQKAAAKKKPGSKKIVGGPKVANKAAHLAADETKATPPGRSGKGKGSR